MNLIPIQQDHVSAKLLSGNYKHLALYALKSTPDYPLEAHKFSKTTAFHVHIVNFADIYDLCDLNIDKFKVS